MNFALPRIAALTLPRFFLPACPAADLQRAAPLRSVARRQCAALGHIEGCTVTCISGSVWLTHDGDCKDVVLARGESHTVDRNTRVLAQGLEDTVLRIA